MSDACGSARAAVDAPPPRLPRDWGRKAAQQERAPTPDGLAALRAACWSVSRVARRTRVSSSSWSKSQPNGDVRRRDGGHDRRLDDRNRRTGALQLRSRCRRRQCPQRRLDRVASAARLRGGHAKIPLPSPRLRGAASGFCSVRACTASMRRDQLRARDRRRTYSRPLLWIIGAFMDPAPGY
jgi:hypothetical protein